VSEPLVLTVRFQLESAQLVLEYTVVNESAETVYLTNHGVSYESGGPVPDRNQVWVHFEKGVVHLSQRQPKNPGDAFRQPMPHFVTPVLPGKEFRQRIALALPLAENVPYRTVKPSGALLINHSAYFSVGYKRANRWFEPVELERSGRKVWVLRSLMKGKTPPPGPVEVPVEEFLVSERFAIDIPVQETVW
jgi:hypothetical protein